MKEKNKILENEITRRDFIKGTAYGTLSVALGLKAFSALASTEKTTIPFNAENPKSKVVLVRNEFAIDKDKNINENIVLEMIDTAIKEFSGEEDIIKAWSKYFRSDDTVGIKITNCEWMKVPTHPEVLNAIIKRLNDIGISKERIYAKDYDMPLEQCTALINVPSIKVHSLTGIAVSIKNYINFDTENLEKYHFEGSTKLAETWLKPEVKGKTRLIIVDALTPYFGPGPQINPIYHWDYKGILVGTDPVAIDTFCVRICQEKRNLFKGEKWEINPPPKSIFSADTEYHLGTSDPLQIKVIRLGWKDGILI